MISDLNHPDEFRRMEAFRKAMSIHPDNAELIERALTDNFSRIRVDGLRSIRVSGLRSEKFEFTPAQQERALLDIHQSVRAEAALRFQLNAEQIRRALADSHEDVRSSALYQANDSQRGDALFDKTSIVRITAVRTMTQLNAKQHELALNDSDFLVRLAAVKRGGLTPDQLAHAIGDDSFQVREAAAELGGKNNLRSTLKNMRYHIRCWGIPI